MEPTKTLTIFIKNANDIKIVDSKFLAETTEGPVGDGMFLQTFNIFPPQIYSLSTPEDVTVYLQSILQDNHQYSFSVNPENLVWNLNVDGIEFHVHKNGMIVSEESGNSFFIMSDLPRNNLKLYQAFLPFLALEKNMVILKKALEDSGLAGSFNITAARGGFKIDCFGYPDDLINFELFFYTETNVLKFIHLLRNEDDAYYQGSKTYKISEIYNDIERLQRIAEQYRSIEKEINSIKIVL